MDKLTWNRFSLACRNFNAFSYYLSNKYIDFTFSEIWNQTSSFCYKWASDYNFGCAKYGIERPFSKLIIVKFHCNSESYVQKVPSIYKNNPYTASINRRWRLFSKILTVLTRRRFESKFHFNIAEFVLNIAFIHSFWSGQAGNFGSVFFVGEPGNMKGAKQLFRRAGVLMTLYSPARLDQPRILDCLFSANWRNASAMASIRWDVVII